MKVNVAGVWKTVTTIKVNVAGVWRTVTGTRVNVGGAWKVGETFLQPLTATISDSAPQGSAFGTPTITTAPVTVTPVGGASPYTYSWALISGVGAALSPTLATTRFRATVDDSQTVTGLFRCTVTDALSSTVTIDANATFTQAGY